MARINRSDVIQKAVNDLALSQSTDKIPNETLDKVQLTYDLNRHFSSFCLDQTQSATGSLTLGMPTIDSRSEIYITSIDFDIIKDATCDMATGSVGATVTTDLQGISKRVLNIGVIILTAQSVHAHVDFAYPLKIKANTNITSAGTYTVGTMSRAMSVAGFIVSTN